MSELHSLEAFSTCDVADALMTLGANGYLHDIVMHSPEYCDGATKIIGPACTVKMVPASDTTSPKLSAHYVDTAPKGSVIYIDVPPNCVNAVWGGLMAARATSLGVKGVVIHGRCRDLDELREMSFPVFCNATSILGAAKLTRPSTINEPITHASPIGQVITSAGDYIMGDRHGVVRIPSDKVSEVLHLCTKNAEADGKCMEDLKNGKSIQETFAKHRGK